VSSEPLAEPAAPDLPRPAGVVDLGRYRGRTGAAPVVVPPPRDHEPAGPGEPRAALAEVVVGPLLVPDRTTPRPTSRAPEPAAVDLVAIRRLRLGSVLRMAFGLSVCAFLVVIGAAVVLWVTVSTLGVVANVESLVEDLGWVDVRFDGPAMLRAIGIGGGILVVAATVLSVVFAEVFNLLSTITGGLRAEVGPPPLSRRARRRARPTADLASLRHAERD
jgi:hypothetical protein